MTMREQDQRETTEATSAPGATPPGTRADRAAPEPREGGIPGAIAGTSLLGPTGGTIGADPGEAIATAAEPDPAADAWRVPSAPEDDGEEAR